VEEWSKLPLFAHRRLILCSFYPENQLSLQIDTFVNFKYETIFSPLTRLLHGDILNMACEGEELSHQVGQVAYLTGTYTKGAGRYSVYTDMSTWRSSDDLLLLSSSQKAIHSRTFEVRNTFTFPVMNMRALLKWWRRTSLLLSVHWNEQSAHPYTKQTNTSSLSFSYECESGIYLHCMNWNINSTATVTAQ